jgi:hypothetical protein
MEKPQMPHDGHEYHLCYLQNVGFVKEKFAEYKKLVKDSKFVCTECGRTAASDKNLCGAQKI